MEQRLIELEIKLSYQESIITDLNESVIAQQREIDRLKTGMEMLKKRLQELQDVSGENLPHTRPPHY